MVQPVRNLSISAIGTTLNDSEITGMIMAICLRLNTSQRNFELPRLHGLCSLSSMSRISVVLLLRSSAQFSSLSLHYYYSCTTFSPPLKYLSQPLPLTQSSHPRQSSCQPPSLSSKTLPMHPPLHLASPRHGHCAIRWTWPLLAS